MSKEIEETVSKESIQEKFAGVQTAWQNLGLESDALPITEKTLNELLEDYDEQDKMAQQVLKAIEQALDDLILLIKSMQKVNDLQKYPNLQNARQEAEQENALVLDRSCASLHAALQIVTLRQFNASESDKIANKTRQQMKQDTYLNTAIIVLISMAATLSVLGCIASLALAFITISAIPLTATTLTAIALGGCYTSLMAVISMFIFAEATERARSRENITLEQREGIEVNIFKQGRRILAYEEIINFEEKDIKNIPVDTPLRNICGLKHRQDKQGFFYRQYKTTCTVLKNYSAPKEEVIENPYRIN
ncbi:MAG: hypothetical protein CMF38_02715 [Legionellaceae bacterium]|nr:hypothetical protein [Legionellaceae bacterium]HAF87255.1 hypothetical protein [Legionellales bacterium]HCA90105.1 hypothetical protein [Legionellales bacterium]|tara:strand:+ start:2252 stop:3172 length:921 start_codon:yes stop_codon:yes gene_type:complete